MKGQVQNIGPFPVLDTFYPGLSQSCVINLAGKFLWESFWCYLHVNHSDMHMTSTCSQDTVSMVHLQHVLCSHCVCTCTHAESSLLLHSCCRVHCLGCCVNQCHKLTLHLGVCMSPQNIPLKLIIKS